MCLPRRTVMSCNDDTRTARKVKRGMQKEKTGGRFQALGRYTPVGGKDGRSALNVSYAVRGVKEKEPAPSMAGALSDIAAKLNADSMSSISFAARVVKQARTRCKGK